MSGGRLAGKVAVIVGAGQQPGETMGNGRAVAQRFAEEGASLLLVDVNPEWVEQTLPFLPAGAKASTFIADVTREADCKAIVDAAVERHGRIDILYNNVGRSKDDRPTAQLAIEAWDDLMDTNLRSAFLTVKHALPVMIRQGGGSIINISSTASMANGSGIAYTTGKGALNTMTEYMAFENAPHGIRVNAILPGLMDTPMAIERRAAERGVHRDVVRAERNARVPMGAMGEAWDVANAAVFLASDEARYITGVLLPVDGGLLLKRG